MQIRFKKCYCYSRWGVCVASSKNSIDIPQRKWLLATHLLWKYGNYSKCVQLYEFYFMSDICYIKKIFMNLKNKMSGKGV